jgi:glycosyltransferase involved in cell wall biosynthesis
MSSKVLIASGSRHSIPPVQSSPGVPRIIFQLTEKDTKDFQFVVLSKSDKALDASSFDTHKYLHPKPNLRTLLFKRFLKVMPYRWLKKKYGFSQPDRIVYYTSLVRKAKQVKPDIVVTFMHVELFKMLQKALPVAKHVFFFRSTDLEGRIGKENINFLLQHSAGFLANTKAPIDELKTYKPNLSFPVATIYNAVPSVTLNLDEQKNVGATFRKKFGLDATAFVLGYAGRFSEEKSLVELFGVMKTLKDEGVIVHLIIAGDIANEKTPNQAYYNELMAYKDTHLSGQIHLAGWITNVELYHFYCALDLGVLLSKYREGNSMFLIEAMSYGVPVVATNVGGNLEIVQDGINGNLIDNENLDEALFNVLLKLSQDFSKLKTLGDGAIATTAINHNSEKMVEQFNDFLKKV